MQWPSFGIPGVSIVPIEQTIHRLARRPLVGVGETRLSGRCAGLLPLVGTPASRRPSHHMGRLQLSSLSIAHSAGPWPENPALLLGGDEVLTTTNGGVKVTSPYSSQEHAKVGQSQPEGPAMTALLRVLLDATQQHLRPLLPSPPP